MGLNFQTCTIINSNIDLDSKKNLFELVEGENAADNMLFVKRDFRFYKDNSQGKVCSIRSRAGYDAAMCKATIDFAGLLTNTAIKPAKGNNYCRLDIYLGVEGAEPSAYATPWIQKGRPLWVEFTVSANSTAADIVKQIEKSIKKNRLFLYDKDLLTVTANGTSLVLEGAEEFQRFRFLDIVMFDTDSEYTEKVAELGDAYITLNERGYNSFGTYSQIIKDLRLPTAANTQWLHLRQSETPIVGAIYDQYIIEYEAPSTNHGLQAVGERMRSHTTHVFWVKNDTALLAAWKTALEGVGKIKTICCAGPYDPDESDETDTTPTTPDEGEDSGTGGLG